MSNNQLPADTVERIKADANKATTEVNDKLREKLNDFRSRTTYVDGYHTGYIAGATVWAETAQLINVEATITQERAHVLADALDNIVSFLNNELRSDYLLSKIPKYNEYLEALQQWKEGKDKQVELSCTVCGIKFMGPEPEMCCSGRDCGCMGLPIEPIVCSEECYNKGIPPQKGNSGVAVNLD